MRHDLLKQHAGGAATVPALRIYALLEQLRANPARERAWFQELEPQLDRIAHGFIEQILNGTLISALL